MFIILERESLSCCVRVSVLNYYAYFSIQNGTYEVRQRPTFVEVSEDFKSRMEDSRF